MKTAVFKDAVVLITGASHGIGRELALQLARQGSRLALAARRMDTLEDVAVECRALGAAALAIQTDVGEEAQCAAFVQQAVGTYGKIDLLVNNAGTAMESAVEAVQELSIFEQVMRVNYLGSVFMTCFALPYLKQTKGRIVGVCSLAGKTGIPNRSGYSASKFAMAGFFDALRPELAVSGVSVTMVYPGYVATHEASLGSQALHAMPVETCAAIILRAAEKRKREELMTLQGKLVPWMRLIAPAWIDAFAMKANQQAR
jgi:short-subunit dehydrogenase